MALISSTDADALLEALGGGDTVTLGATSVPCIVAGPDAVVPGEGPSPAEGITQALVVTVRTGALAALAAGATVTVRGASYTVDRVVRKRNEALTDFTAYPA